MTVARNVRNAIAWAIIALMPVVSCASATGTDEAKVVDTMRALFVAATHDNMDQFHRIACPDFYAFDVGKQFSGDELMSLIKKDHAAGDVFVWQVTEPKVHVDGSTAWITYINRGSFANASGKRDVSWLESAVLTKHAGGWCIRFLHSTPMPAH
ncbi:nuclear transport factor 2 family protein [Dyella monticola]|uniref:Nuclear transport factor 2 family protein n=1 Tax=Dyella monticola TaxID=1927958 RepID=A0A370WYQ7_9GAMM|nr:DUF4440 domain-containing protein [Dyella monticola]RDS81160.1 nuclear transport factor 2 family protein [Dyella monticola]